MTTILAKTTNLDNGQTVEETCIYCDAENNVVVKYYENNREIGLCTLELSQKEAYWHSLDMLGEGFELIYQSA